MELAEMLGLRLEYGRCVSSVRRSSTAMVVVVWVQMEKDECNVDGGKKMKTMMAAPGGWLEVKERNGCTMKEKIDGRGSGRH